jgi:hypothetical protein
MAEKSVIYMFYQWSKYRKIYPVLSPLIAVKTFIFCACLILHLPNLHIVIFLHFSQLQYEN